MNILFLRQSSTNT